jgi:hypothetical protein
MNCCFSNDAAGPGRGGGFTGPHRVPLFALRPWRALARALRALFSGVFNASGSLVRGPTDGAGSVTEDARRDGPRRVTPRPAAGPTPHPSAQAIKCPGEKGAMPRGALTLSPYHLITFPPVLLGPGGVYLRPWPRTEIVDA